MHAFFVRIGAMAEVHTASCLIPLDRGQRVIVRTERGVELGEVVQHCRSDDGKSTARIVRPTTSEDEFLIRRLERHKREAVEACRKSLADAGSCATLLDVDQLFDGGTLLMHFLGPVDAIAESITKRIVDQYESVVRVRHFSKLLRDGCGPGCGTDSAGGCGTSCSNCSVGCGVGK